MYVSNVSPPLLIFCSFLPLCLLLCAGHYNECISKIEVGSILVHNLMFSAAVFSVTSCLYEL